VLGECQPTVFVTTVGSARVVSLSVYAGYVYYTTADSVLRQPTGSGTAGSVASAQAAPTAVRADAGGVHWCNYPLAMPTNMALVTAAFDGSKVTPLVTLQTIARCPSLASDGTNLYWGDELGRVWTVPIAGGAAPLVHDGGAGAVEAIALDSTSIYVSQYDVALQKLPRTGPADAAPTPLTSFAVGEAASELVLDGAYLYWPGFIAHPPTINRVPTAGGAPNEVLVTNVSPSSLMVDASYVYFIDASTPASVRRIPKSGGPATTLYTASAGSTLGPAGMDAAAIYFAEGTRIMKLAK
jgi:hypothetical protein